MVDITIFDTIDDLCELTGLDRDGLDKNDFYLDACDGGFRSKTKLHEYKFDDFDSEIYLDFPTEIPFIAELLIKRIDDYCVGFECFEYDGYFYYLMYHA